LAKEEIEERMEIALKLDGKMYWVAMDVWLFTVLKRKGINTVSIKAWSVRDKEITFGPLPDDAELI